MPTIGRATIDVHYDGKGLPREAKELGEETGATAGEAHAEAFDKEAEKGFAETREQFVKDAEKSGREAGTKSGNGFGRNFHDSLEGVIRNDLNKLSTDVASIFAKTDGLDNYSRKLTGIDSEFGRVEATAGQVYDAITQLHDAKLVDDGEVGHLLDMLGKWEDGAGRVARANDDAAKKMDELWESAKRANDEFDKNSLERVIDREGEAAGASRDWRKAVDQVRDSHEKLNRQYDLGEQSVRDLKGAQDDLRDSMEKLNPTLETHRETFKKIADTLGDGSDSTPERYRKLAGEVRNLTGTAEAGAGELEKLGSGLDHAGDSAKRHKGDFDGLGSSLGKLGQFDPGDNMGQLFALIIALAPQVAVLAGAAGAGLLILAGGAAALALSVAGGFIGFSNLFGDLKDVEPSVRPAARALQDFVGADGLGKLREALQEKMFVGLAGEFDKLRTDTIPALEPAFGKLGGALNTVLSRWIADMQSSGFAKDFDELIDSMTPSITGLGTLFSNLVGIVKETLSQVAPYTKAFIDGINGAAGDFLTFMKSPQGHKEIKQFFDDMTPVLGAVGDAFKTIGGAFKGLITKENIKGTIDALDDLSGAVADLVTASGNLGDAVPAVAAAIKAITGELGKVAEYSKQQDNKTLGKNWIDELASGVQAGYLEVDHAFDLIIVGFGAFFRDLGTLVSSSAGAIGTVLNDLATPAKWGNIGGDLDKMRKTFSDGFANISGDLDIVGGDLVKFFDALPDKTQGALSKMSTNFGLTGDAAKEFGGEIFSMAGSAGVDIDKLDGKNLNGVIKMLGLTGDNAQKFRDEWSGRMSESGVAVDKLDASTKRALDKVSLNMGDTGRKSQAFQQVVSKAADDAGIDLTTLSQTKSLDDLERRLGITGAASKTEFANKIIAAAADSGESIDKLPPKIGELVKKYGTIPKDVKTDVSLSGTDSAISQAGAVRAALDSLHDKRINITQVVSQIGDPGKGGHAAVGGIMAGGKLIAGGTMAAFAGGGIVKSPQLFGNVLTGEAGEEAIVPLTGPLSRVDASVRQLSAYARGKTFSGGSAGTSVGRQVTVSSGAVQVITNNANPGQVASAVLDRLVPSL